MLCCVFEELLKYSVQTNVMHCPILRRYRYLSFYFVVTQYLCHLNAKLSTFNVKFKLLIKPLMHFVIRDKLMKWKVKALFLEIVGNLPERSGLNFKRQSAYI